MLDLANAIAEKNPNDSTEKEISCQHSEVNNAAAIVVSSTLKNVDAAVTGSQLSSPSDKEAEIENLNGLSGELKKKKVTKPEIWSSPQIYWMMFKHGLWKFLCCEYWIDSIQYC
ncbi:hypothetical protein MKX01_038557 [Papaver californicum]|nr:hypothetical protein MKX01_038557 [Papaver californicum]